MLSAVSITLVGEQGVDIGWQKVAPVVSRADLMIRQLLRTNIPARRIWPLLLQLAKPPAPLLRIVGREQLAKRVGFVLLHLFAARTRSVISDILMGPSKLGRNVG